MSEITKVKGLGRGWSWSDFVQIEDARAREALMDPPEMNCTCADGEDLLAA